MADGQAIDPKKVWGDFTAYLNSESLPEQAKSTLTQLEASTSQPRQIIVAAGIALFVLILLAMDMLTTLVCDWIGFFYPAYASFVALETPDNKGVTTWLKYWVIYGFFFLFVDSVGSLVPMYDYLKITVFVACMLPGLDISSKIYDSSIKKGFEVLDSKISSSPVNSKDS